MFYVCGSIWSIWNAEKQHPERKSHYDNDRFKKEIPAIKYVNFEYSNFPMEIDDDIHSSIEELEQYYGNEIPINIDGNHKDINSHCVDAADVGSVGEYVNKIDGSSQLNNKKWQTINNRRWLW